MRGLREHVDGLYLFRHIPERRQNCHVSCERCGVAGYVDDAVGAHGGEGFQDGFRTAGSRRVDNDDMWADVFVAEARHDFCGIADEEGRVFYVVITRVLLRVLNRGLDDLDAVDVMGFLCEEKRDRACTHHALTSAGIEAAAEMVKEKK